MSHPDTAFVDFNPGVDELSALKVAIDSILTNHRLVHLGALMTDKDRTGGLEGDPGWIVERRDTGDAHPYYEKWPRWASFRALVDPDVYLIKHPECFMDAKTFFEVVNSFVDAYVIAYPDRKAEVETLLTPQLS